MLMSIRRIVGAPIMSLHTGQPLGQLSSPIINPYNLKVMAFYVVGPRVDYSPAVIFTDDIREFGSIGAIVDSVDNIMSTDGLVRLNEVIAYNFQLSNMLVYSERGDKLGRVADYVVDPINYQIQQLHVRPGFLKSFKIASLIITRSQIVKVEPNRITVKDATIKQTQSKAVEGARRVLNPDFDNPFRKQPATNPVNNNSD